MCFLVRNWTRLTQIEQILQHEFYGNKFFDHLLQERTSRCYFQTRFVLFLRTLWLDFRCQNIATDTAKINFVARYRAPDLFYRGDQSGLKSFEIKLKDWKTTKLESIDDLAPCYWISAKLARAPIYLSILTVSFCKFRKEMVDPFIQTLLALAAYSKRLCGVGIWKLFPRLLLCLKCSDDGNSLARIEEIL